MILVQTWWNHLSLTSPSTDQKRKHDRTRLQNRTCNSAKLIRHRREYKPLFILHIKSIPIDRNFRDR